MAQFNPKEPFGLPRRESHLSVVLPPLGYFRSIVVEKSVFNERGFAARRELPPSLCTPG